MVLDNARSIWLVRSFKICRDLILNNLIPNNFEVDYTHLTSNMTIPVMSALTIENNSTLKNEFKNEIIIVYSWSILSLSFFVILGFIGNLLVCMSIKIYPKLQAASNYYLFSLAATDLLVSVVVVPLAIIKNLFSKS